MTWYTIFIYISLYKMTFCVCLCVCVCVADQQPANDPNWICVVAIFWCGQRSCAGNNSRPRWPGIDENSPRTASICIECGRWTEAADAAATAGQPTILLRRIGWHTEGDRRHSGIERPHPFEWAPDKVRSSIVYGPLEEAERGGHNGGQWRRTAITKW